MDADGTEHTNDDSTSDPVPDARMQAGRGRSERAGRGGLDISALLDRFGEQIHVRRSFGDPIERDGVTIIPVALVAGGGGGGEGHSDKGDDGGGSGFGGAVRPLGVYEIRGDEMRFVPAVNATAVAVTAIVAGVFALGVVARLAGRLLAAPAAPPG